MYLDLVILLPAIGALSLLLQAGRKIRMTGGMQLVAWGCLAAAPVGIFTTFIEPFHLRVERTAVPLQSERAGKETIRIAVLADLQTPKITRYEQEAIDRLMAQTPDIILLPGDMFQGSAKAFEQELPVLQGLLAKLKAPGGVYLTPGNVDDPQWLRRMTAKTDVKILCKEKAKIQIRGRSITVGGVDAWHDPQGTKSFIAEMEDEPNTKDIRILVSHIPDAADYLKPQSRIDLVISGHTHGGQVRIPFYGSLLKSTKLSPEIAAGGLHTLNDNMLYISRGVGTEAGQAPRMRFLCPPEISLLELK